MATHENATVADLTGGGFALKLFKIQSGGFAGGVFALLFVKITYSMSFTLLIPYITI